MSGKNQKLDSFKIIEKYYQKDTELYKILISHSVSVATKALEINYRRRLNLDKNFLTDAAMLHDIGIFMTNAPSIFCVGTHNYIEHGYLGAEILRNENLPEYALVCERHVGTGLTMQDIIDNGFPLPPRDMQPISLEEQLICYSDLFFSKTQLNSEMSVENVRKKAAQWGEKSVEKFDYWNSIFG